MLPELMHSYPAVTPWNLAEFTAAELASMVAKLPRRQPQAASTLPDPGRGARAPWRQGRV